MNQSAEWIGLTDGVYRSNGALSYWQLYTAALGRRIEARREGKRWLVSTASLDHYLAQHRTQEDV
jgi:hypothetical protein